MGGSEPTALAEPITATEAPLDLVPEPERSVLRALDERDWREALTLCARHYGRDIGRLCMAIVGSQAEADDLTQETLLAAHDAFATFQRQGTLRAWLCGIARRRCARYLERSSTRAAKLHLVAVHDERPSSDELLARRQRAERARHALAALRPTDREAVVLRYVVGLSYREVGAATDIEEATARQRVSRALARLRDALEAEDCSHD